MWVGASCLLVFEQPPVSLAVGLYRSEATFVAHFLTARYPVTQVQPVTVRLPRQFDLLQDGAGAETAAFQCGVEKGVDADAMLKALKRYRLSRDLGALPTPNESEPMVAKTRGNGPITSTRHIRRIVQDCFDRAYEQMRSDGLEEDALDLRESTVHWLRHTGISEDVRLRPQQHVRDDAGHGSMVTTSRYIESDERERHASGRGKPARFFDEN